MIRYSKPKTKREVYTNELELTKAAPRRPREIGGGVVGSDPFKTAAKGPAGSGKGNKPNRKNSRKKMY